MFTKLHVFDFDGTLVKTPCDTIENHRLFEKATGMPWLIDKNKSRELSKKHGKFIGMRSGWWGRKETLEPPLVPNPTPEDLFIKEVCDALHLSKKDQSAITIMMTGRHAGLKSQVLRIAADGKLFDINKTVSQKNELFCEVIDPNIACWFLGEDGPAPKGTKPTSTLPWKIWIIEQYLELHPTINSVEIWEDREEHVKEFQELDLIFDQEFKVHFVQF